MKNFINNQFKHFGAFFLLQLKYFLPYFLFVNLGIILVVTGLAYVYLFSNPDLVNNLVGSSFWVFANIGGFIITTSAFAQYGRNDSRMHLFLVPVSPITKFITVFLYAIPCYLITVLLIYYLFANGLAIMFSSLDYIKDFTFNPFVRDEKYDSLSFMHHFLFFIVFQSFTFLAGAFFPKMGFLKTVPVTVVLLVVYLIMNSILAPSGFEADFISNLYQILSTQTFESIRLRESMPLISYFWWGLGSLLIPASWYIAYLRFKELVA
jgi:hypothetical protein